MGRGVDASVRKSKNSKGQVCWICSEYVTNGSDQGLNNGRRDKLRLNEVTFYSEEAAANWCRSRGIDISDADWN